MRYSLLVLGLMLAGVSSGPQAAPWLDSGDSGLRADVERLADAGIITVPVTTWPLSATDVLSELDKHAQTLTAPDLLAASQRLRRYAQRALGENKHVTGLHVASDPAVTRHFSDSARSNASVQAELEGMGEMWAGRLRVQREDEAADQRDRPANFDGSYIATALGNWTTGVGAIDRWWGPARDNGLILSDNARPVPMIFTQRQNAQAFETPWLSWLGPWQLTTFMGQLEAERDHSRALLWGLRATIKPWSRLEFGLSRTAQWGGEGRPQGLSDFWEVLAGNDNGVAGDTTVQNPANQMGGIDGRFNVWRGDWLRASAYIEYIGEDESNKFPTSKALITGATFSFPQWPAWQAFVENGNTYVKCFRGSYNCYYNHSVYTDGYRYEGRPIGFAFDNDTRTHSLGLNYQPQADWQLQGVWRQVRANLDASAAAPQTHTLAPQGGEWDELELRWRWYSGAWRFSAEALLMSEQPAQVTQDNRLAVSIEYAY